MKPFLYFDSQYRDNQDKKAVLMIAFFVSDVQEVFHIDCRSSDGLASLHRLFDEHRDSHWVTYNAIADLTCLDTLGIDISKIRVIDAMVEARMITLTHQTYQIPKVNLPWTLSALGIELPQSASEISACLDLVLGQTEYTPDEWQRISRYCERNVTPLPKILDRCWDIHHEIQSGYLVDQMVQRGEFIKKRVLLDLQSKGFPVDRNLITEISRHRDGITGDLKLAANKYYGVDLYRESKNGTRPFCNENLAAMIKARQIPWDKTATGKLTLTLEYLKRQALRWPDLYRLYQTQKTIQSMQTTDLAARLTGQHVKPTLHLFSQKASRESPKPSEGFVLNLPKWQRCLIKPLPGEVLIAADWSQQEIAIAAVLSGDQNLLDLYLHPSNDVYRALAELAGAITPQSTPEEAQAMRALYKTVQLGLGYGKGKESMSSDIYQSRCDDAGNPGITEAEAAFTASEIYDWHKESFSEYWRWIYNEINLAKNRGYIKSTDDWTYFVEPNISTTKLINFPMQSSGAAMLRRAVIHCYDSGRINLVATLHDALYVTCKVEDAQATASLLQDCMNAACSDVLGGAVMIRIDTEVYDAETGYRDIKGEVMLDQVKSFLASR